MLSSFGSASLRVLYGTAFPQVPEQAVNVKKAFGKSPGKALLNRLKKEMKTPRKAKSVRVADAKLLEATHKST
jgi:hypothetical protein